jgi:hypothetical protein
METVSPLLEGALSFPAFWFPIAASFNTVVALGICFQIRQTVGFKLATVARIARLKLPIVGSSFAALARAKTRAI